MMNIMNKINRVLTGLTGCELEFLPLERLDRGEWDLQALTPSTNRETTPRYLAGESGGSFGFPVQLDGTLAGLAVVRDMAHAPPAQLTELADLLTTVLTTALERESRAENLRRVQEQQERLLIADEKANVVQLRRTRGTSDETEPTVLPAAPTPVDPSLAGLPLLIETPEGFPLQRIALELHEMSARWAFLSLENLSPSTLESREELKSLGGITLFIPDLSTLSWNQQVKLAEYLATKPGADMPQVIAGISTSVESLRQQRSTPPRLIDSFCLVRLNWLNKGGREANSDLIDASLQFILEKARESAVMQATETALLAPSNIYRLHPRSPTIH